MKLEKRAVRRRKPLVADSTTGSLPGISAADCRDILRSRTIKLSLHSDRYLDRWLTTKLLSPELKATTISLKEMKGWSINPETGDICHESGKFFSLIGADIRHRTMSGEFEWDQPFIEQPEVGILGLLAKKISGVLHFCLHAKEEPGNINSVQLSPTVQATYSNYTMVHGGNAPKFVNYFLDPSKGRVIFAKLQTEDGGRFLYKSNRNMIIAVDATELDTLPEGFIWVTLRQISRLLKRDNIIHACTRSILSALIFPECLTGKSPRQTVDSAAQKADGSTPGDIAQWIDDQKATNHFLVKRRPLNGLKNWNMDRDGSFSHDEGRFFRVIGIDVESCDREISIWNQPILDNPGSGIIGLLTKVENGQRYFLLQAKAEPGNKNVVQIGPTVQFTPGNYIGNTKLPKPFLFDEFCHPGVFPRLYESVQSEEGARFYKEAHIHRILSLPQGSLLDIPTEYRWISLSALHFFMSMGETVNSCARSVLSLMLCEEPLR